MRARSGGDVTGYTIYQVTTDFFTDFLFPSSANLFVFIKMEEVNTNEDQFDAIYTHVYV